MFLNVNLLQKKFVEYGKTTYFESEVINLTFELIIRIFRFSQSYRKTSDSQSQEFKPEEFVFSFNIFEKNSSNN